MDGPMPITLIIKAANQKCGDFTVECDSKWSIKYLKSYLSRNYPTKPNEDTIRLIYSGKLLNDDSELKDCIRMNSETNVHNIHIVYKPSNTNDEEATNITRITANNTNSNNNERSELINEATNNINQILNQQQLNSLEQMTPKDQHAYIYNQLKNYYESMGVVMNSWNISYLHHTALYHQMYANYLRSIGMSPAINIAHINNFNNNNNNIDVNNNNLNAANENQQNNNNNNQQAQANNNLDADLRAEEREDDWLSLLHNLCSFFVLFSIVYFYSTFTRFMIVFVAVLLLMLYHGGWFALERRNGRNNPNPNNNNNRPNQPQPQPQQQQQQQNQENNNNDNNQEQRNNNNNNNNNNANNNNVNENTETQAAHTNPNIFRLVFSFVITFFTSLIPERARIPN